MPGAEIRMRVQSPEASSGPTKAYTWKSKLISNCIIWVCKSNSEKFDLVQFQSD